MNFRSNPSTKFEAAANLSKTRAAEQAKALRDGLRYHDYLYYVKNRPAISDAVYDELFRRLQALEEQFPGLRTDDSPTQRVGAAPVSRLKKVRHAASMLSLNSVREADDAQAFLKTVEKSTANGKVSYDLEPKFDGLSIEIVYANGHLDHAATRGDGETGEDITHNAKTIGAIPMVLRDSDAAPRQLAVRGEVFMRRDGFLAVNRTRLERGEEAFTNPRNAAAGAMRQLDSHHAAAMPLDIYFYEILGSSDGRPGSHHETLKQFERWGLKTCPENRRASSMKDVEDYHARLAKRRDDLNFEIDGIVIEVDSYEQRDELGVRARSPRWALAWKFPPREEVTTVEDIAVQVGRSGILTPVALLQPVDVGGVTVSRATLHNAEQTRRKDVRVEDRVRVLRAGDVIPEIKERVPQPGKKRSKPFSMPRECPSCGTKVARDGAYHICTAGLSCPAQLKGRIEHYASREALDIDALGTQTAQALVERDMVQDLADLYGLSKDELCELPGFADKSATRLHDAIQGAKSPRLDRFLYALGIRHVGVRTARAIGHALRSLEDVKRASRHELEELADVGPEIADSVYRFFRLKTNRRVLQRMHDAGVRVRPMPASRSQKLNGKTFVLTGSLESFTRPQAKERIERLGGRAASSVSANTDFVVVGDNPGRKLDEARGHNVRILNEKQFLSMLGNN